MGIESIPEFDLSEGDEVLIWSFEEKYNGKKGRIVLVNDVPDRPFVVEIYVTKERYAAHGIQLKKL